MGFALSPFCGVFLGVLSNLDVILLRKRKMVAVLNLFWGCLGSMFLPYGAMGWSVVCVCGISYLM